MKSPPYRVKFSFSDNSSKKRNNGEGRGKNISEIASLKDHNKKFLKSTLALMV